MADLFGIFKPIVKRKKMKLIEPTMEYISEIQALRQEFLEAGGPMDGCGSLRRLDNIQGWLDQIELCKKILD